MATKKSTVELDVKRLAIASAGTLALCALLIAVFSALYGVGNNLVAVISSLWGGYGPSAYGIGVGVIWGLIDGAIIGAVFAWIYNNAHSLS